MNSVMLQRSTYNALPTQEFSIYGGDTVELILNNLPASYNAKTAYVCLKRGAVNQDLTDVKNALPAFSSSQNLSVVLSVNSDGFASITLEPRQTAALQERKGYVLEIEIRPNSSTVDTYGQYNIYNQQNLNNGVAPADPYLPPSLNSDNIQQGATQLFVSSAEKTQIANSKDIFSFTNLAGFPATGVIEKLYIARDTDKIYIWDVETSTYKDTTGSSSTLVNSDQLPEGQSNLYFTTARQTRLQNKLDRDYISDNVVVGIHYPGPNGNQTTLSQISQFETDTSTSGLGVLYFIQIFSGATTFPTAAWNSIKDILDSGRVAVVNIEPMSNLATINAGNYDAQFTDLASKIQAYATANPLTFTRERLLIKFMHEGNLSVGAYPWVVYDSNNLGQTFNKFTTSNATVLTAINNFKTGFQRLASLLGNTNCLRIFELGQDSWSGAPQRLSLFFPSNSSFEIAAVNSYNRYGVSSGYAYWSSFGNNLTSWIRACNQMCPSKPKMIGEMATTASGVVNPFGSPVTITNGGSGFPASVTNPVPASAITHNGATPPQFNYTTNASGVITGFTLVDKGEDVTACSIASGFDSGVGFAGSVNLRQTNVSKADWVREAFLWLKNHSDFRYMFWFLENKNVSPTDNRDWYLNTVASRSAFSAGWALVNRRVRQSAQVQQWSQNLVRDPYTQDLSQWNSAGANAGLLSLSTLPTNLPYYKRHITSVLRLAHSTSGGSFDGLPFSNRIRYFLPYWLTGLWNLGLLANDEVTITFDALFKPFGNPVSYDAPLLVALEDINSNAGNPSSGVYERSMTPQMNLTKQFRQYRVVTSQGQFSSAGFYIDFMIGAANTGGELLLTDVNARLGDTEFPLLPNFIDKLENTPNSANSQSLLNGLNLANRSALLRQLVAGSNVTLSLDANGNLVISVTGSSGSGDMLKSVYDTDNSGVVDNADRLGGNLPNTYATSASVSSLSGTVSTNSSQIAANSTAITSNSNSITALQANKSDLVKTPLAKINSGAQQFGLAGTLFTSQGTSTANANEVRYTPWIVPFQITLKAYLLEVSTGPIVAGNIRFGIYQTDADLQPTSLVQDFGAIAITASFAGTRTGTIADLVLNPGVYLVAVNVDQAMSLRTIASPTPVILTAMGASSLAQRLFQAQSFAALPAVGTKWTNLSASAGGIQNSVFFQWT